MPAPPSRVSPTDRCDLLLLFLSFGAGAVDAISFLTRGWPNRATAALELEPVAQTAFLAAWLAASGRPGQTLEAVLVGLSGLAMGLLSAAVIALRVGGVSTTYVTRMLTGLIGEIAAATGSRRDVVRRTLVTAWYLLPLVERGSPTAAQMGAGS